MCLCCTVKKCRCCLIFDSDGAGACKVCFSRVVAVGEVDAKFKVFGVSDACGVCDCYCCIIG